MLGSTALPNDLLRPYPGYGGIRMWDYSGYSNYHALQTGVTRRFDDGFMFSVFYVWSKALGINNDDFSAGVPNQTDAEVRRLDYSLLDTIGRTTSWSTSSTSSPNLKSSTACSASWRTTGSCRASTAGRAAARRASASRFPNISNANLTGSTDGNPGARIVLTCDPGGGWSGDPYAQFNTSCFAPPQPGSDGAESARFFVRQPPINNLDLSLSKIFAGPKSLKFEVRLDMFNALNHTQFTGFNGTANFASLTDRDDHQPAVRRERRPRAAERLRGDQRRGAAAHAAARHPRDVLRRVQRRPCGAVVSRFHRPVLRKGHRPFSFQAIATRRRMSGGFGARPAADQRLHLRSAFGSFQGRRNRLAAGAKYDGGSVTVPSSRGRLVALLVLLLASGAAGLAYQVLWLRELSLILGVTVHAAATVLAAFMGGLALGSITAGRVLARLRRPLLAFGLAEIGIGVSALAVGLAFDRGAPVDAAIHDALGWSKVALTAGRFAVAAALLLVPTSLMGLTMPLVCASATVRASFGQRLGLVYGVNTAGGILGALATGFYALGALGSDATLRIAATMSIGVGLAAIALSKATGEAPETAASPSAAPATATTPASGGGIPPRVLVAVVAASGAGSMALEVLWFRALVQQIAATTYAFTAMLAVVLTGIALGSLGASWLMRRPRNWTGWLAGLFYAMAAAALGSLALLAAATLLGPAGATPGPFGPWRCCRRRCAWGRACRWRCRPAWERAGRATRWRGGSAASTPPTSPARSPARSSAASRCCRYGACAARSSAPVRCSPSPPCSSAPRPAASGSAAISR